MGRTLVVRSVPEEGQVRKVVDQRKVPRVVHSDFLRGSDVLIQEDLQPEVKADHRQAEGVPSAGSPKERRSVD